MIKIVKKALLYLTTFALILQSSLVLGLFNPQKAHAQTPSNFDKVLLNEFISNPTDGIEKVEIYNTNPLGSDPVDISYWYVADSLGTRLFGGFVPEGTRLESGEFYVFESSSPILNNNDDEIYLWGPDWVNEPGYVYNENYPEEAIPQTIDNLNYGNTDFDLVAPPAQGKSAGRLPDGSDTWYADLYPTLGTANIRDLIAPTSAITYPVNNGYYNSLNPIAGTEEDTGGAGINKVEIKIEKNSEITEKYFDGTGWTSTETWLSATMTNSWIYNGLNNSFLTDGETYTISSRATDNAGNAQSPVNSIIFNYDTSAPTGSLAINSNATVTNSYSVTLALASADAQQMKISNTADLSDAVWENFAAAKNWTLSNGTGNKIVYAQFKDASGNISAVTSDEIYLDLNAVNIVTNAINSGVNNPIFPIPGVELNITGLSPTTLTTAIYPHNPGASLPSGITGFGLYLEMAVANKNAIAWPISVKIYYTANDLSATGITDENQLLGLYFWEPASSSWKLYDQTGVNTDDITLNGVTYAGYVWANADHLTPMVIGSDITAPNKPANFTATAGDGEISINWDQVSDATGYYVRYREGTSLDDKPYTTIYLTGAQSISTKVTGLKNNTLYEFGVKTVDKVGNLSDWAVVVQSPVALIKAPDQEVVLAVSSNKVGKAETPETVEPAQKQETEITTIGPEEGKVKAEKESTDWTRFWIVLLVLIIALGAGYGGYYGYQWWMEEKTKKGKVNKVEDKPEEPQSGGRW